MTEQYRGQTVLVFLEYANEATARISEINKLICGTGLPENGSLLGIVYDDIFLMVEILLAPIVKMEIGEDRLSDMVIEIMHADKDEISTIIKENCDISI